MFPMKPERPNDWPMGVSRVLTSCTSAPEAPVSSELNGEEGLLVRCIALRGAYGGMAGDVAMLRDFVALWRTRSATTDPNQHTLRQPVQQSLACCLKAVMLWQAYLMCPEACRDLPDCRFPACGVDRVKCICSA